MTLGVLAHGEGLALRHGLERGGRPDDLHLLELHRHAPSVGERQGQRLEAEDLGHGKLVQLGAQRHLELGGDAVPRLRAQLAEVSSVPGGAPLTSISIMPSWAQALP